MGLTKILRTSSKVKYSGTYCVPVLLTLELSHYRLEMTVARKNNQESGNECSLFGEKVCMVANEKPKTNKH